MPKQPTPTKREEILLHDDEAGTAVERRTGRNIDEAIRRAEAAGEFTNLPGKGKPLAFRPEEGMATLDERWLSNHILKNAEYVPPWAESARALERARARSAKALEEWRGTTEGEERGRCAAALTAAWEAENDLLRKHNRVVPDPSMQRYPIPVARRWERLTEEAGRSAD